MGDREVVVGPLEEADAHDVAELISDAGIKRDIIEERKRGTHMAAVVNTGAGTVLLPFLDMHEGDGTLRFDLPNGGELEVPPGTKYRVVSGD